MKSQFVSLSAYMDALQRKGVYTFLGVDAIKVLNISDVAFASAANRLIRKKRLVRPRHGFYVIVPVEYQIDGAPTPDWYIDELMSYQKQPYYVALLSAAALHGAAHQQPQVFQVITNKPLRSLRIGRARIEFYTKKNIKSDESEKMKVPTGYMQVATPEMTALDLIQHVKAAGYLNNIATVLSELIEKINGQKLLQLVNIEIKLPFIQRLGYLLELVDSPNELINPLNEWVKAQHPRFTPLRPDKSFKHSPKNNKWQIYNNENVEKDL